MLDKYVKGFILQEIGSRFVLSSTPSKKAVDFKIVELCERDSVSCLTYFIFRGVSKVDNF